MTDIRSAVFIKSSPDNKNLPPEKYPEYAFIGRSNVGKSSLINMLTLKDNLAKTSGTPGKTQLINHFLINDEWYLVDLPGYGYARVGKDQKMKFEKMIDDYLTERGTLMNTFLLIDVRHEPLANDLDFIQYLGESALPFSLVFTKADKLGPVRLQENVERYKSVLMQSWEELPPIFVTSSEKKIGRTEILNYITSINQSSTITA
jgi:GTP-binding protein